MGNLYDKYIEMLVMANDESVTEQKHQHFLTALHGWKEGVFDAIGRRFNGDYYYIAKIDAGEMAERPMCCGEFLDWKEQS